MLGDKVSQSETERWFAETTETIQKEYERFHYEAREDPQYAGHNAERAWQKILQDWLPPHYEVGIRKYILPDESSETEKRFFETDLVIFNPAYPEPLRKKSEILSGGILAAFYVRLTADPSGIKDASERAAILKRSAKIRLNTPRHHLQGSFSVGLLAHSHTWKSDGSAPFDNVNRNFKEFSRQYAKHPREILDFICIADLALWVTQQLVCPTPEILSLNPPGLTPELSQNGYVSTSTCSWNPGFEQLPVARLVMQLIYRLSYVDPTFRQWALGLLAALPNKSHSYVDWRHWKPDEVLPAFVLQEMKKKGIDNLGIHDDWYHLFA